MTTPLIAIEPVLKTPIMAINWLIGTRCQFECQYCPDFWHDKTSKDKSLATLKKVWLNLLNATSDRPNLKFKLTITGGEPTINKNLLPFLKWLRDNYNDRLFGINCPTNTTRSIEYYKEMINYVDTMVFSMHSEFTNEKKFFATLEAVHNHIIENKLNKHFYAHIMDEPWHAERNKKYVEYLTSQGIKYKIVPLTDFGEDKSPKPIRMVNKIDLGI